MPSPATTQAPPASGRSGNRTDPAAMRGNAASRQTAEPGDVSRRRLGVTLAVVLAAQLMIILDLTVVNIALPGIARGLHLPATELSWVMNAYSLTFGGLLLLGGRVGDILGRRRVFMA